MAAQEKVPTPKEQELAKERLSSCDRPTSATLASPFLSSTLGDLMSCETVREPLHPLSPSPLHSTSQAWVGQTI